MAGAGGDRSGFQRASRRSALRGARDTSLGRVVEMVRDGSADAALSAGNSGAFLAIALVRHWSLIQIGASTPPALDGWFIVSKAFRENLEWAVVVPGDDEMSPAVAQLLAELSARGVIIHDSRFGAW